MREGWIVNEEVIFSEREIAWLRAASPDDWHRVALDYNWDEGVETLYWIVQQPDCDRATALDIFWKGQPAWYLYLALKEGRDEADDPTWTMLKYIAARIHARGYTRSKIAFDATPALRQDFAELSGYAEQLANPPLRPHRDMLRSARGREIVNDMDFYRRYPFAHSAMIETPALDEAAIDGIPDLAAARSNAHTVVLNLFGIGVLAMTLVLYPTMLQNFTSLAIGLASFGLCAYFATTEFRDLNGLLRANRLRLVPSVSLVTLVFAALSGAAASKVAAVFRDWIAPAYGMVAISAAFLVLAAFVYMVFANSLARLLISSHAMREV